MLNKKQIEYLYKATHRYNIKCGATRSGKTFLDLFVIPKRIFRVKNQKGIIVFLGNTKGTLQRNIIDPLRDLWGDAFVSNIKADNTANIFGEKVYCLGADKANQVDRLRGSSIKYCYGDEITTWNEDVFNMLKSRLDSPYSKFDGTCNPESPNHWFKEFLDNKDGKVDIYCQTYTIYDNEALDKDIIEALKNEYSGTVYYNRFILGEWAKAQGIVYDNFTDEHIYKNIDTEIYRKWICVDYGIQNPTCFLLMGFAKNKYYVLKEYYYSGKETHKYKTDSEIVKDLIQFANGHIIENITIDPSALSLISECRFRGLPVVSANNKVIDGIRKVSNLLGQKKLLISENCKNLIREMKTYVWDDKSVEEKPLKIDDHCVDALRYGINYINDNLYIGY